MYFPQKFNHVQVTADRFYLRWISSVNFADVRVRALGIVFISFMNVSVGAFFYKIASGSRRSWTSAFFRVYSVLLDAPGSDATDDDEFLASLVLNIIYLVGLIVFAVLIGMVGEEVTVQVLQLRHGRPQLEIKDHILILNWNSQGLAVVRQLLNAKHRKSIVVLADEDKAMLDSAIAKLGPGKSGRSDARLRVRVRRGLPFRREHLSLVCASEASIIILLYPEAAGNVARAETLKAVTVAALTTLDHFQEQPLIVQVPNELSDNQHSVDMVQDLFAARREGMLKRGGGMHVVRLSEQSIVDRLVAQSSIQPGMCSIYETILSHGEQVDFDFVEMKEISGKFADVRRRFPSAVTCGFVSSFDGQLHLNPEDSDIVTQGDKVVFLAPANIDLVATSATSTEACAELHQAAEEQGQFRNAKAVGSSTSGRKICVVGWVPEQAGELVAGFSEFSPAGTHVTVVVDRIPEELREYLQRTLARSNARAAASKRQDNSSGGWGDARLQATIRRMTHDKSSNNLLTTDKSGNSLLSGTTLSPMTSQGRFPLSPVTSQARNVDFSRLSGTGGVRLTASAIPTSRQVSGTEVGVGGPSSRQVSGTEVGVGGPSSRQVSGTEVRVGGPFSPNSFSLASTGSLIRAQGSLGRMNSRQQVSIEEEGLSAVSMGPVAGMSEGVTSPPWPPGSDNGSLEDSKASDRSSPHHGKAGSTPPMAAGSQSTPSSVLEMKQQIPRHSMPESVAESVADSFALPAGGSSDHNPIKRSKSRRAGGGSHEGGSNGGSSNHVDRLGMGVMVHSFARRFKSKSEKRGIQFTVGQTDFTFKVFPDPLCEEALRAAGVQEADSVVLGTPSNTSYPFSDAQLLSALFLIQSLAAEADHKVHVVAKVTNSNTKKIAHRFFQQLSNPYVTYELLLPQQITSAVLTQTAWQPNYMQLVQELLVNSEGMELYIVDPARLGFKIGDVTTFAEVTEAARLLSYTVLGFTKGSGFRRKQVLAPHARHELVIEDEDKIIILAEEWE